MRVVQQRVRLSLLRGRSRPLGAYVVNLVAIAACLFEDGYTSATHMYVLHESFLLELDLAVSLDDRDCADDAVTATSIRLLWPRCRSDSCAPSALGAANCPDPLRQKALPRKNR